ncbi:MAG TPA: biofilm regulation diguanylate cyclase SiaD [Noviherbaspirillum sp.]|uniref:biofilm regulation diguanylate cyclase SiaD n=1 Tax=Noviherbaspirillum sp. TaxID=1926288 RepID=UPI002B489AB5|nr:biofilm regulation diguanylate cyclase SiaD [Noviherbaspirillum sp.]HJV87412.1 biofilm regulation diguanylate cyclase SiaD [Noviherbaspirillum sp.]
MRDDKNLELVIEMLLADPAHKENPLHYPLQELYQEFRGLLRQIDRITRISDGYQSIVREEKLGLTERYQRQLRQLEKIAHISDRYQSMMRDLNEALKEASTKDPLTGIGNRRLLMDRLKAEAARAERMERPLTIALADVDHFKTINDSYGHEAGDKALIEIAGAIKSGVRDYDICGRWGGEEFLVIMPEIGAAEGVLVVERMRNAIAALELDIVAGSAPVEISATFGIAERRPGESISDTIRRADTAMLQAKREGRNRYRIAE